MTVATDEATVKQFIEIISARAVELAKGNGKGGALQLSTLSPVDEKMIPQRFKLDDVDGVVDVAISAANAGLNVYIEARTVHTSLRGKSRGAIADTEFVFGLVIDADHDKGKGGNGVVRPSLTVETSPGNFHYWYLFDQPVAATRQSGSATSSAPIPEPTRTPASSPSATGCPARPTTRRKPSRRAGGQAWSRPASSSGRIVGGSQPSSKRRSQARPQRRLQDRPLGLPKRPPTPTRRACPTN